MLSFILWLQKNVGCDSIITKYGSLSWSYNHTFVTFVTSRGKMVNTHTSAIEEATAAAA